MNLFIYFGANLFSGAIRAVRVFDYGKNSAKKKCTQFFSPHEGNYQVLKSYCVADRD